MSISTATRPASRRDRRFRSGLKFIISARDSRPRKRPKESHHVRRSRSEDEPGFPDPGQDEGLGARQSRRAEAHRKAGAGAQARRGSGPHRRGRDLRHRPRNHRSRPAGVDPGRHAVQQELHARPRIYGHGGGARSRRRRITDRPARHGRDPCRLRPVQALPRGHVHLVPQLRPQLRRRRQGPSRQRLHHRRRLLRIPGQQHQHAGRRFPTRCRTRRRRWW